MRRQLLLIGLVLHSATYVVAAEPVDFDADIRPLFREHCITCHGPEKQEGGLRLDSRLALLKGGDSGAAMVIGKSAQSELIHRVASLDPSTRMPPEGDPLTAAQIAALKNWVDDQAVWPEDSATTATRDPRLDHWAWRPLQKMAVPQVKMVAWPRGEIDRFILATLEARSLEPSAEADRRTLIRRLSFDLLGLPPTAEEIDTFVADADPLAYEKLVDRYLESPRHGERWARHWLDVVHYGDTHGYDKDKIRPNAWPYRDYVIRAFNEDKPYARFVEEQVAGDVLHPGTKDGIVALGFLAAGPWDFIGHAELPESKIDGKIARHLDRDDMVANTLGTFCGVTIHCAQCHNHKFDPFTQEDYYSLQAVFAAVDRADRKFFPDDARTREYQELESRKSQLVNRQRELDAVVRQRAGSELTTLDQEIEARSMTPPTLPEFGYHSAVAATEDLVKWVAIDVGEVITIERITLRPCHDDFNQIGAGFGFPVRYRIEIADNPEFREARVIIDRTDADVPNPGLSPQSFGGQGVKGRHVRVTATKLAPRQNDYIFALAELQVFDVGGKNRAMGVTVTAADSIEAPPRWRKGNLVDDIYLAGDTFAQLADLKSRREELLRKSMDEKVASELVTIQDELTAVDTRLIEFPPPEVAYVATVHTGSGNFLGTGANGGQPRPIAILARGDVRRPGKLVDPGAVAAFQELLPGRFELRPDSTEGDRRAALANWLTDPRNPLTWRTIVNRVWQYHFGRGIVETSNDFGKMGTPPTHAELLDWLAVQFHEGGGSLKALHRLIVTSATYRQSSSSANPAAAAIDVDNRLLWRQQRRKLEAEAVRDAVLFVSGSLDLTMGGPGWQDFVIEQEAHSPHYQYHLADPQDRSTWRRSIYRFVVRSQTQPFMTSFDCADPSIRVERRNESQSAAQALAMLNNGMMVTQAAEFAARVRRFVGDDHPETTVTTAFRLAFGRDPTSEEQRLLVVSLREHGLETVCRALLNLNEFAFVD